MPRVSVVVPTHNRPQMLKDAVEMSRQALAICREVFLIDDMQADAARKQLMV
jgi:glycosyltransferase involved in cell wall biosynthesis